MEGFWMVPRMRTAKNPGRRWIGVPAIGRLRSKPSPSGAWASRSSPDPSRHRPAGFGARRTKPTRSVSCMPVPRVDAMTSTSSTRVAAHPPNMAGSFRSKWEPCFVGKAANKRGSCPKLSCGLAFGSSKAQTPSDTGHSTNSTGSGFMLRSDYPSTIFPVAGVMRHRRSGGCSIELCTYHG